MNYDVSERCPQNPLSKLKYYFCCVSEGTSNGTLTSQINNTHPNTTTTFREHHPSKL